MKGKGSQLIWTHCSLGSELKQVILEKYTNIYKFFVMTFFFKKI